MTCYGQTVTHIGTDLVRGIRLEEFEEERVRLHGLAKEPVS